jgi:DNA-binding GntR family transcriptional regulator
LPTELELAAHYKTSRHSIRAALLALAQQGLIGRRKHAGTRVLASTPSHNFQMSYASIDGLASFGATNLRVLQEVKTISASPSLAALLDCPVLKAWLCISSLRVDEGSDPIGWTDIYVSPFHGGLEDRVKAQPQVLICTLLERHYQQSIATIQQIACAVTLSSQMAKRLNVQPGAAGLRVIRRYLDANGEAVEISVSFHPAERFSISTRLLRTA